MAKRTDAGWFQMNNMTPIVRRAVKVAAAMEGMSMQEWVMKAIRAHLNRKGVIMEGGESNGT